MIMYRDKFVLSIIHDGHPVKETGRLGNKEVALPFGSEYKIRLKNKNNRSCTARVFIDGKKVSQLGDIIISAGGSVDLERYIDSSLDKGKRFKFVSVDHPDVDDPTSSSNGIIKVEFKKAKHDNGIKIKPDIFIYDNPWTPPDYNYKEDNYGPRWVYDGSPVNSGGSSISASFYSSSNLSKGEARCCSLGATIEGSQSHQQFTYSALEVEDESVTLTLKIVGIRNTKLVDTRYKYCTRCGQKLRHIDKYCSACGCRT
jgi:hypothetical protein